MIQWSKDQENSVGSQDPNNTVSSITWGQWGHSDATDAVSVADAATNGVPPKMGCFVWQQQ